MRARPSFVFPLAVVVGLTLCTRGTRAQSQGSAPTKEPTKEIFTAFAVNMSNIGSTTPTPLDITITRWTTVAEQERLTSILGGKGQSGLVDAMQKTPSIGSIRTPTSLSYDFRYATQERTRDGRRRIILVTDRPIDYWEVVDRPPTIDYPFAAIELLVDDYGKGTGSLWIAARLTLLDNLLIVDNYANRPITLNDVHHR
jgi:hypothetical protein